MADSRLTIHQIHARFVAEVKAQIADLIADGLAIKQLKTAWQETPVMIFRRQVLSEDELVEFSSCFGDCEIVSRKDILSPYRSEVIYFSTLRYADGRNLGGFAGGEDVDWHSDQTFRPNPATGAVLYGVEVPRDGGDIYWANQYNAYELLPQEIQTLIEGKNGTYRYAKRLALLNPLELKDKIKDLSETPDVSHPVVLTHPVTGRKALYADPTTLVSIQGLSKQENDRVLQVLFDAGGDPSIVYRHKVISGDVMIWDNGCTMHRRDVMSLHQPRLMKRTTFRVSPNTHCVPHPEQQ